MTPETVLQSMTTESLKNLTEHLRYTVQRMKAEQRDHCERQRQLLINEILNLEKQREELSR